MKTIKTLISALTLAAGMTAQAQQVMTVKTDASNEKFALSGRFVLDLTGSRKVMVRSGQQTASYTNDTKMLIYLMPTAEGTYQLVDGIASLYVPEDMQYSQITYTRNFSNTDWQLLYLPLKLNYEEWCNDFDVAMLNDVHQFDSDNDGVADETALEVIMLTGGSTEPNTPYVIRARRTGRKTITQNNATLYATMDTERTLSNWNTYFVVKGTYNTITADKLGANTLCSIDANSLQAGGVEDKLDALRWYITVTNRDGSDSRINRIRIYEKTDDATGIGQVEESGSDDRIYDLSGRQVKNPTKGIYIKNGRKVMLR